MEKRGDLTEDSHSDFDTRKKVKFIDKEGFAVAGEGEKEKLASPTRFKPHSTPPGYSWPVLN
ncbi:hypothetical protein EKK58_00990 [Candidatus Dependentiae bacterium]|nr:MAG: hypothetical protein EKK58_00990 [Candidatus Dependentiae bacterium]